MISKLHYITPEQHNDYVSLIEEVCESGINWVQLRIKNASKEEIIAIGKSVLPICKQYNVPLIINDSVEICQAIDADGVHLGQSDGSLIEARKVLGAKKIIGATVNTFAHIQQVASSECVDYCGLGPYRWTSSKQNLNPILGQEGVMSFFSMCRLHQINIPTVVIGGITPSDVKNILQAGAHGVAVISAIHQAENKQEIIQQFYNEIASV